MENTVSFLCFVIFIIPKFSCASELDHLNVTVTHSVHINTQRFAATTDERFLSVALDSNMLKKHWETFHFHTVRLVNMVKALNPGVLRIGGTAADFSIFDGGDYGVGKFKNFTNFTIYPEDIDRINKFSQLTGLDVLYDLNVLLRSKDGSWNSSNSISIMKYVAKSGYHFSWELGNEPNAFKHLDNKSISASQLGHDFRTLRSILDQRKEFGSFLGGPSAGLRKKYVVEYVKRFLSVCGCVLDAVTWHHYYLNGAVATLDEFYDPKVLDSVIPQMELVRNITTYYAPQAQVWLGETSSAYGGGALGISDSYAAGFMWLDKLGLAARLGHKVVIRQTLFHGNYALIDKDLEPNPDYWTSLLYKTLVGSKVLEVKLGLTYMRKIRVYAHCTNPRNKRYSSGSVTVFILNIQTSESVQILLSDDLQGLDVDEYLLTPAGNITSKFIELNGSVLKLVNNTFLPEIKPKLIPSPHPVLLPPLSYGFYVIPQAKAVACLTKDMWS